jgi:hypothetical protein
MKALLAILFLIGVFTFSSCTQEYSCQCVVKYTGMPPGLPDSTIEYFAIRNKKKKATAECEENSTTISNNGITMIEKCQLY